MYAIIQTGGKQYRVTEGDEFECERLPGEAGDPVTFDQVLAASDGDQVTFGRPFVEGSQVAGRIIGQAKSSKVIVYKFKRRKGYRRKRGHRQSLTRVKIQSITV